ncbi:MAG TPA: GNAT family N-acetyltransferase [Bacillota bacterium]|nr:GNAT family N-acetyltransferase [Bacillota bacterium]
MELRKAGWADSVFLLNLRNDETVRRSSFNQDMVEPAGHERWLTKKLADADTYLFIAEQNGQRLGQIRFELNGEKNLAEVSIAVAKEFRGKGIGVSMLLAGCPLIFAATGVEVILAQIRAENLLSRRMFERAGFQLDSTLSGCDKDVLSMVLENLTGK